LKSIIKKAIVFLVKCNTFWSVFNATIVPIARYVKTERKKYEEFVPDLTQARMTLSPDHTVLHGPFKGMKYPKNIKHVGGALIPKLLGCYEREIHPIIDQLLSSEYSEIVNIGCAEGYYAVGFAMRIKSANVYAYDINKEALRFCKQIAYLNGVADRLIIGDFCDPNTLKSIPYTKKALIISDCEGYEKELFTEEIIPLLAHHDLLIEIHDGVDIEISSLIRRRFQNTHRISAIQSIDDIAKVHSYCYEELSGYSLTTRKWLLSEGRGHIMEWYYLTPLIGASS
jgi:hypothetical protein